MSNNSIYLSYRFGRLFFRFRNQTQNHTINISVGIGHTENKISIRCLKLSGQGPDNKNNTNL